MQWNFVTEMEFKHFTLCAYFLLITANNFVLGKLYYVIPTPNTTCPEEGVLCFTLTQYASKPNDFFAPNITFSFLPGNHTLDLELRIQNITTLKLTPAENDTVLSSVNLKSTFITGTFATVTVSCNQSERFNFERIEQIQMSGIAFTGCVDNLVSKVDRLLVEDCSFNGEGRDGTGLNLNMISNVVIISRTSFVSNSGTTKLSVNESLSSEGGAIVVMDSSYVIIYNCSFFNNTVTGDIAKGGAISVHNSKISITSSLFDQNSVFGNSNDVEGGSLYADNSTISLFSCVFTNNTVVLTGDGGAVYIDNSSIEISCSTFDSNFATDDGGAVYVFNNSSITIQNSLFIANSVIGNDGSGGALYAIDSTVSIDNGTFTENAVFGDYGEAQGAAIFVFASTLTMFDSVFILNIVTGDGGAVYAYNSTINITSSEFTSNVVYGDTGVGGALAVFNSTLFITNCTIFNTVSSDSGALYAYYSQINVADSTFTNNNVTNDDGDGGAISAYDCILFVTDSTFTKSTVSGRGGLGGALLTYNGSLTLSNSTFTDNTVTGYRAKGGAVAVYGADATLAGNTFTHNTVYCDKECAGGGMYVFNSVLSIETSTFIHNSVPGDGVGGAVYVQSGYTSISNSTFTSNAVTTVNGEGGAVLVAYGVAELSFTTFLENTVIGDYGAGGAVVALGSSINVSYCIFSSNSVIGGGSGGALLSYDSTSTIFGCTFARNSVNGDDGSGGAVFVYDKNATIINSTFEHNNVTGHNGKGGALYLQSTTLDSSNIVITSINFATTGVVYAENTTALFAGNTTISNNHGSVYAFSSNMTFAGLIKFTANSLLATDSEFNVEGSQGVLTGFQSTVVLSGTVNLECNSAKNGGAILLTESKIYIYGNVTVMDNTAALSGGGIYAYKSELNFEGLANIKGNTANDSGGGIHIVGSFLKISAGLVIIDGNYAKRGGGMSLVLNSNLYVIKRSPQLTPQCNTMSSDCVRLELSNNYAVFGGALFISDGTGSGNCEATHVRTQSTTGVCFIQVLALYTVIQNRDSIDYDKWSMQNIYFTNNSATVAGGYLYGGLLDRCTVSSFAEVFTKYLFLTPTSLSGASYVQIITNLKPQEFVTKERISSESVRVCFCRDNRPDCNYQPQPEYVQKGETFKVSLVAVDQVNNTISNSTIHGSLSLHASLGEGQSVQQTSLNGSCTDLAYNVSTPHDSEQLHLYADGPCMGIGMSTVNLTVNIAPCPIGFNDTGLHCDCDPLLYPEYVSYCSIDDESVLRKDNVWFSFVNNTKHHSYIFHRYCPFDYCNPPTEHVFVNLNIPNGADALCTFNRSGKLCGSCEDGLSLSLGSSRCTPCSNNWLVLVLLFIVAGIALVAFLLICNLTVAVGTINGLIFYANVISANRSIFIKMGEANVLTIFIAWINLDFGFETCFYDGLDGYAKVWFQLVFPLYILFLVRMVILIAKKSSKFGRLLLDRNPVATLSTLILLSYTKFIRTIIAVLSFATLTYSDSYRETVWLFDANIRYFEGKHIPLFITAVVIIVLGFLFTFLLLFWQWIMICSDTKYLKWLTSNIKFNTFIDAFHAPYNSRHRYWTGLLLLARVVLYLISALNVLNDPSLNLIAIVCLVGGLLLLNNPSGNVYKKWPLNVLESSYIFNLMVFAAVTLFIGESKGNQSALVYTSTSIAFVTFIATIVHHTFIYVLKINFKKLKAIFLSTICSRFQAKQNTHDSDTSVQLHYQSLVPRHRTSVIVTELDMNLSPENSHDVMSSDSKEIENPTANSKTRMNDRSTVALQDTTASGASVKEPPIINIDCELPNFAAQREEPSSSSGVQTGSDVTEENENLEDEVTSPLLQH